MAINTSLAHNPLHVTPSVKRLPDLTKVENWDAIIREEWNDGTRLKAVQNQLYPEGWGIVSLKDSKEPATIWVRLKLNESRYEFQRECTHYIAKGTFRKSLAEALYESRYSDCLLLEGEHTAPPSKGNVSVIHVHSLEALDYMLQRLTRTEH